MITSTRAFLVGVDATTKKRTWTGLMNISSSVPRKLFQY